MKRCNIKGFTLLEVIVALAVLAIALAALVKAGSQNAENAGYLRDKTLAHWVALNLLTEIQLGQRLLESDEQKGQMTMAEREWFWVIKVFNTAEEQLRRLEIRVYADPQATEALVLLVGFVV